MKRTCYGDTFIALGYGAENGTAPSPAWKVI
jgi:hypothetical protein